MKNFAKILGLVLTLWMLPIGLTSVSSPSYGQSVDKILADEGTGHAGHHADAANNVAPSAVPVASAPIATAQTSAENAMVHDLTVMGMYNQAHPVVKAVMIGLVLASILTWTILIAKAVEVVLAKRRAKQALYAILQASTLAELAQHNDGQRGAAALLVKAATSEVQSSLGAIKDAGNSGLKERLASTLSRIEVGAGRRISRGTAVLATIGSIAPFVGLFGTVWGIMNSFIGIAKTQTTNLAVVAPGIAEALLATAIGLAAAIPAVVIYNMFVRWIGSYRHILADCSAGIERIVSRDLDYHKVHKPHAARPSDIAAE